LLVNAPSVQTATLSVYEAVGTSAGLSLADAIIGGNTYIFNTTGSATYLPIILRQK